MGKDLLNEFVEAGWLDRSVTEGFDPYFESSWLAEGDWRDDEAWDSCRDAGVWPGGRLAEAWL